MGDNTSSVILRHTQASAVCLLYIKVAIALHIGICHKGGSMIAYHRARIVARQFPHGKYTAFALLLDERADEGLVQIRIDNRHQRVVGTERVPQRENGIDGLFHATLMHFQIHAKITPVGIGKQIGLHTRMIKRRIEHGTLVFILRLDIYLGKVFIP